MQKVKQNFFAVFLSNDTLYLVKFDEYEYPTYIYGLLLKTVCVQCHKPVIAAVHGACVGAGLDLICACDIRYCTQDAWFQVKVCVITCCVVQLK